MSSNMPVSFVFLEREIHLLLIPKIIVISFFVLFFCQSLPLTHKEIQIR